MYLLFHPLVSKRFTYPEPQMLLSRMNLLKCTKMLSNSICVFISHALHFSQRDAVCTSTRINFSPTSTLFIGGRGGWCPISGQLSMGLFSSSVKQSGLFAIKRLRRLIRKSSFSISCSFWQPEGALLGCPAFLPPDDSTCASASKSGPTSNRLVSLGFS